LDLQNIKYKLIENKWKNNKEEAKFI
jgi:hypothetical protein